MPELPEVEAYRSLAERGLHRLIVAVDAPDSWFLKGGLDGPTLAAVMVGRSFRAARRIGKLLLLDTSDGGPVLGLRFGMTGRLVVDAVPGVGQLLYSGDRAGAAWDRFGVGFDDGGHLLVNDPRRLGGVDLDPDEARLGPDALSLGGAALARALTGSRAPLKARLLDQTRVAGIGNLIADETLWRAGLDPRREAGSLSPAQHRRLHRHLRAALGDMMARGGSHTGDFLPARRPGGTCPRDGAPLLRGTVGGRTTWWCAVHQR